VLFGVRPMRDLVLTSVKLSVCNVIEGGDMCYFLMDCRACRLGRCCV
jgi:hypothetical protein